MTDFALLLSRIQAVYSMPEIAFVLDCTQAKVEHYKAGVEPQFSTGMRIVALHDRLTGRDECAQILARATHANAPLLERAIPRRQRMQTAHANQRRENGKFAGAV